MQRRFGSDVVKSYRLRPHPFAQHNSKAESSIVEKFGYTFKRPWLGNTPMLHFLQGYSAKSLAVAPFTPVSTEMKTWDSTKLGISQSFPLTVALAYPPLWEDSAAAIIACSMDLDEKLPCLLILVLMVK